MPSRRSLYATYLTAAVLFVLGTLLLIGALTGRFYEPQLHGLQEKADYLAAALGGSMLLAALVLVGPIAMAWHRRRRFRWVLMAEGA